MVYQEIIEGCSYSPNGFFIKHLCDLEQIELTRKRIEFVNRYIEAGVPLEEERVKHLKENGDWSNEKDEDIKAYRQTLADNEKSLSNIIPQQQEPIRRMMDQHKKELIALMIERKMLIGTTAEELSDRDSTVFLAYLSLYKDRECKQKLFPNWEDFEALEEDESQKYLRAIDDAIARISEKNVKKIGCLPFFLNAFSYCKDSIHTFIRKPICELTNYQVLLFSAGSRNLNVLSEAEGSPPEYYDKTTADEILKWYDTQYSIIIGKRRK